MMSRTNIKDFLFFGMLPEEMKGFVAEPGIEVHRIPRSELFEITLRGGYLQLGTLGLLQLVGGMLSVDMWRSSYEAIEKAFLQEKQIY
jgi:hypothetical protein